jgi:hypothetical protein
MWLPCPLPRPFSHEWEKGDDVSLSRPRERVARRAGRENGVKNTRIAFHTTL